MIGNPYTMVSVTIYTTPTCPWCEKTKDFLEKHDIEYAEKDVAGDQDAAKEMITKSGQRGVPVTVIETEAGEETIIGFDEDALREELGVEK